MNQIESWIDDKDWKEEDEWECAFGEHCLVPHFIHRRDECYTIEMAQEYMREEREALQGIKGWDL